jgi:excinuclease UvrABC nuclease subunit
MSSMREAESGFEATWHRGSWEESEIAVIPEGMGVYQLVDAAGRVLYVGFAKDLRAALLKHLGKGDIPGVAGFRWAEYWRGEEAQEMEEQLIEELAPSYNE